jgi:hypothetical protein
LLCFESTGVTSAASIGVPEAIFNELPLALADAELELLPVAEADAGFVFEEDFSCLFADAP